MLKILAQHCLIISCLTQLGGRAVGGEDDWIGRTFMPKAGAKLIFDGRAVAADLITGPYTVTKVRGESLWDGGMLLQKSDVVPIEDAERYYSDYIRAHPDSGWTYCRRGIVRRRNGDLDAARNDFNDAIRLDPTSSTAYVRRGNLWAKHDDFPRALDDYATAIRLNPTAPSVHFRRAIVWMLNKEYDNALGDLNEAIRLDPDDDEAFYSRAFLWQNRGEPENALKDFSEAIRLAPNNADYYVTRAIEFGSQGRIEETLKDINVAIRLDPKIALAYHIRAGLIWETDYGRALADYGAAIRLDPTNFKSYRNRGVLLEKRGDFSAAVNDYAKAIELAPQDSQAQNLFANMRASCPVQQVRNGREAVEHAIKACELSGWAKPFYVATLAAAYAEAGDFKSAVDWQLKAIEATQARDVADSNLDAFNNQLTLYRHGMPFHGRINRPPATRTAAK